MFVLFVAMRYLFTPGNSKRAKTTQSGVSPQIIPQCTWLQFLLASKGAVSLVDGVLCNVVIAQQKMLNIHVHIQKELVLRVSEGQFCLYIFATIMSME